MKKTREISDAAMYALLSDYKRPQMRREDFDALLARAGSLSEQKQRWPRPFLGPILAAAALLLIGLGIGVISIRGSGRLDSQISVSRTSLEDPDGQTMSSNSPLSLKTLVGESINILSPYERISLSPESQLSIKQNPLRLLSGERGYQYSLGRGSLILSHQEGTPAFSLDCPYGKIIPAGTSLELILGQNSMTLRCLEGSILFKPRDGSAARSLDAGSELIYSPGNETQALISPSPATSVQPSPSRAPSSLATAPPSMEDKPRIQLSQRWKVMSGMGKGSRIAASATSLAISEGRNLALFQPQSGALVHKRELSLSVSGLALSDSLFLLQGSEILSLKALDGKQDWKATAGPSSFADLGLGMGLLGLASADGRLYLFQENDGRALPPLKDSGGLGMYGRPLFHNGLAIVSNVDRRLSALRLDGSGTAWSFKAQGRFSGDRPILMDEARLVIDTDSEGRLYALNMKDGSLAWQTSLQSPLSFQPVLVAGLAIYQDGRGVSILDAEGNSELLSDIEGGLLAVTALESELLILSTEGIYLLSEPQGKREIHFLQKSQAIAGAAWDGRLYSLNSSGELSAWSLKP